MVLNERNHRVLSKVGGNHNLVIKVQAGSSTCRGEGVSTCRGDDITWLISKCAGPNYRAGGNYGPEL